MQLQPVTIERFGVTTFRLRAAGLIIFLDAWLDRPSTFPSFISLESAIRDGADYILISHAHFDHLPGAAALANATGAIVVGNCEAINVCRSADVPAQQLLQVSGGERIPLFTKDVLAAAAARKVKLAPDFPNAIPRPHPELAVMSVQVWPGLHALLPNAPAAMLPDILDTATVPEHPKDVVAGDYACTADITRMMQFSLIQVSDILPDEQRTNKDWQSLLSWLESRKSVHNGYMSACDGGNMIYNLRIPSEAGMKALLWNGQLGYYPGIFSALSPKPDLAILSVAGQGNLNGRPVSVSAAEFLVQELKDLHEPERVMWCLNDDSPLPPFQILTEGGDRATPLVERKTRCKVITPKHKEVYRLW